MTRSLHYAAFFVGLAVIGWVGLGYIGTNPLALLITLLIAAFYLMGAFELHGFHQATSTLARAVADTPQPPASLAAWLAPLHASLQNAVRLRVEGERVGLPGPALAPYLAGLLVLLGMLGTFLGMVVTLTGTGIALESASDVQAIRNSLSAPVKGLGLAFGTSVAGVAASAMLGLVSALCRRDRLQAAQWLDTRIATSLRSFSLAYQREESFKLLQRQTEAMPALVDSLRTMMAALDRQSQGLNERLITNQDRFHGRAEAAYAGLAASVDRSLQLSLTDSARVAGAAIQPAVEATMAGIARETAVLHRTIALGVQRQLDGLSTRFEATSTNVAEIWQTALAGHQRSADAAQAALQAQIASRDQQRLAAWTDALAAMAASLRQEWQQTGAQTASRQQQIGESLARTAHEMSEQAQAQARNTAEIITELRQKLSDGIQRDNTMLEERGRILDTLATVLAAVNHASTEQRAAIDALVASSAQVLDRIGARFADQVDAQTDSMGLVAAQLTGSAVEVASLGEAFGLAVQLFSQSNDKLGAQLQRIEGALGKSLARSDEQLAYYVAQAREVIDLSTMSQKQIVEDLQRLAGRRALAGSDA